MPKALFNRNKLTMDMSTPELKENYPGLFANPAPDTSDEEIAEGIKHNARLLNDLFDKDKRISENVMEMLYGNDGFYNLDAGLALAVVKFVGIFGANVDDMIDEIDNTATLANKKSGSELQEFVGNFIKDHILDIASIVGSLSTGGIGAAASLALIYILAARSPLLARSSIFRENSSKLTHSSHNSSPIQTAITDPTARHIISTKFFIRSP